MRISDWSSDVCSSDLLAVLGGVTALPGLLEQRGELAWTGGALAVTIDEGRLVRIGSADLRRRQRREDRLSAGGQVRGEADADVGDQRRPADRKSDVSGKSVSVRVDLGGRRIIKHHERVTST